MKKILITSVAMILLLLPAKSQENITIRSYGKINPELKYIVTFGSVRVNTLNEANPQKEGNETILDAGLGIKVRIGHMKNAMNTFHAISEFGQKYDLRVINWQGQSYEYLISTGLIDSIDWNDPNNDVYNPKRYKTSFMKGIKAHGQLYAVIVTFPDKDQRKLARDIINSVRPISKRPLSSEEKEYKNTVQAFLNVASLDGVDELIQTKRSYLTKFFSDTSIDITNSKDTKLVDWQDLMLQVPEATSVNSNSNELNLVFGMYFQLEINRLEETDLVSYRDDIYSDSEKRKVLSFGDQQRKSSWIALHAMNEESQFLNIPKNSYHGFHTTHPWEIKGGSITSIETSKDSWGNIAIQFERIFAGISTSDNSGLPVNYQVRMNVLHQDVRRMAIQVLRSITSKYDQEINHWSEFQSTKLGLHDQSYLSGKKALQNLDQITQWNMFHDTGISRKASIPKTYTSLYIGLDFEDSKPREMEGYEARRNMVEGIFNSGFGKTFLNRTETEKSQTDAVYERYKRAINQWPSIYGNYIDASRIDWFFNTYSRGVIRIDHQFDVVDDNRMMPKLIKDYMGNSWGFSEKPSNILNDAIDVFSEVDFDKYDIINLATVKHSKMRRAHAMSDVPSKNGTFLNLVGLKTNQGSWGNLTHEYLHLFGLPDLYWTQDKAPDPDYPELHKMDAAINMDIMSGKGGLIGIHQYFLGWLQDQYVEVIEDDWEGVLDPLLSDSGTSLIMFTGKQRNSEQPIVYCIEVMDLKTGGGILIYRLLPTTGSGRFPVVFARKQGSKYPDVFKPGESWGPFETMEYSGPGWSDDKDLISVDVLEQVGQSYKIRVNVLK